MRLSLWFNTERLMHTCFLTKLHAISKAGKVNTLQSGQPCQVRWKSESQLYPCSTDLFLTHTGIYPSQPRIHCQGWFSPHPPTFLSVTPSKDGLNCWHHTATYSETYTCQITSPGFCGSATAALLRIKFSNITEMLDDLKRLQYLFWLIEFYLPSAVVSKV